MTEHAVLRAFHSGTSSLPLALASRSRLASASSSSRSSAAACQPSPMMSSRTVTPHAAHPCCMSYLVSHS